MSAPDPITTTPRHRVVLHPGVIGVRLELAPRRSATERPLVCGTFRVPKKDPLNPPSPFHRWLVCVVHFPDELDAIGRPALVPRAVSPFGSRVLLADDEVEHQGHVEGSFGLDVLALLHHGSRSRIPDDEARRQPFTVSAVLGVHTSNALDVDVR